MELRPIDGFEGIYSISPTGDLFSHVSNRYLKSRILNGYSTYSTKLKGKNVYFSAHREVAKAYLGMPENYNELQINHIDGNKLNNCVSNLEWVTPKENSEHAVLLGRYASRHTSIHSRAKLEEKDVINIRLSNLSIEELCNKYLVSERTIQRILKGESWQYLLL